MMTKHAAYLLATIFVAIAPASAAVAAPQFKPGNPNWGGGAPGCGPSGGVPGKCYTVPEIDLANGTASLIVLLAGLALLAERRRRS